MTRAGGSELVAQGKNEYIKEFYVYDGSDRLISLYQARNNANDGEPALLTEYTYVGATAVIEKMRESQSTWSAAYDI